MNPFQFANWSTVLAFIISWIMWVWVVNPLIDLGILTIDSGFTITAIFTVTSWLRVYLLNKLQFKLNQRG